MSNDIREVVFDLTNGEDSTTFPAPGLLGPGTLNVMVSNDGELVSYDGNVKAVNVDDVAFVDAATFFDSAGRRWRLLISADGKLYYVSGQGVVEEASFPSNDYRMFVTNQNMVTFHSPTNGPYKFDGHTGLTRLGVVDVPSPPEISLASLMSPLHASWDTNQSKVYFRRYHTWGVTDPDTGIYEPFNPMQDQRDKTEAIDRSYDYSLRFYNKRGQAGPMSRATTIVLKPAVDLDGADTDRTHRFPIVEWQPPRGELDVAGALLYRTANFVGADNLGVAQLLDIIPLPGCRYTDNRADGSLGESYDGISGFPAPKGRLACIFKDVMLISGDPEYPNQVRYSAPSAYEDWPIGNGYLALGRVSAIIPLSRAVVIVTDKTLETVAFDDNGFLVRQRTEQTVGETFFQSFVAKDDAVVGWFDRGFGSFDGFQFRPSRLGVTHIRNDIRRSQWQRAYILPTGEYALLQPSFDGETTDIFIHNFMSSSWYRLNSPDYITCMWMESSHVYAAGDEGIFAFGKGASNSGRIEISVGGLERRSAQLSQFTKYLRDLYFRLSVRGSWSYSFSVAADGVIHAPVMSGTLDGSEHIDSIVGSGVRWDADAAWTSPRRKWLRMSTGAQIEDRRVGDSFTVCIDFTGPICISALYAAFNVDDRIRR